MYTPFFAILVTNVELSLKPSSYAPVAKPLILTYLMDKYNILLLYNEEWHAYTLTIVIDTKINTFLLMFVQNQPISTSGWQQVALITSVSAQDQGIQNQMQFATVILFLLHCKSSPNCDAN